MTVSSEVLSPHVAISLPETPLTGEELSRLYQTSSRVGRFMTRAALSVTLAVGLTVAVEVAEEVTGSTPVASADTGGYPYADKPCVAGNPTDPNSAFGKTQGVGYWCVDYQWGDIARDSQGRVFAGNQDSERGFGFRNCTDWAALRAQQITGVLVPYGAKMGHAGNWDDNGKNVPGFTVDNTPEVGDIAVWDGTANSYGHVAVVESVNQDGTVNVSEYNRNQDGNYGTRSNLRADHYLDLNGTNPDEGETAEPQGPTFVPAIVQRPSGETDVAVVGPGNSLDFYFNASGSSTWGKMTVPGAQAFSDPAMLQRSSGETDIAVQGPGNSLYFYFNEAGSLVWHKLPVAFEGAVYSDPAMVQRSTTGETAIAVQGPNHTLDLYINTLGSPYWGRFTIPGAQAYGQPAMLLRSSGELDIAVQGPNNSLDFYYNTPGTNSWGMSHVAVSDWAVSPPAMVQRPSGETDIAVEGPSNSLDFYMNSPGSNGWGRLNVAGLNTTQTAPNPPAMVQRANGETNIVARGPGDRASFYYNFPGSPAWGTVPVAVGGYSFRAPSMVQRPTTGETDLAVIGPHNRLDFYLNTQGSPYWGVLPIGGEHSAS